MPLSALDGEGAPVGDGNTGTSSGTSQGSSAAAGIAGVLAAIAGIAAFVGLSGQFDQFVPANLQRALDDLRRQIDQLNPIKF